MGRRWDRDEDDQLRRRYGAGISVGVIASELQRSEDAIVARRRFLEVPSRRASVAWKPLEDALLRSATGASLPATSVADRLKRPQSQVRARRRQLGLAKPPGRRYSADDDARLCEQWTSGNDLHGLAQGLRRSPDALRLRAEQLGLHRPRRRQRWTTAEDATVRDGYANGQTCREIARSLAGRSPSAVSARARKLGLATYARRWHRADDNRLQHLLKVASLEQTAGVLGRTPEGVRRRARKLGLQMSAPPARSRAGARWSEHEDDLLRLHANLNPASLAALLKRSDRAVTNRLRHLGLRHGRERSPHHPASSRGGLTPGERQLVARAIDHGSRGALIALAGRLDLPPKTVRELAKSLRDKNEASPNGRTRQGLSLR